MESSVGPYSIQRLIKSGGQGQVYLGYDRRLNRQVAIKIHQLPTGRKARRRALIEARSVAAIQSARVVHIYDVVQSSDYLAMVMEYVPGCDLEEFLSVVRPSLASVITVAADLAAALAASRQQGLVHGDLKAANVLITPQGRVKLTDFGIARENGGGAFSAGSLSAIAPEQLSGREVDIRTDLFSLGRLLYRMLTGKHSHSRAGVPDAGLLLEGERQVIGERMPDGSEVPPELASLVHQLLCPNPEDRPRNTHHVRRILRDVSRQLPMTSSDSLLREARPYFRRESAADIPPQIPQQLLRHGRSSHTRRGALDWSQLLRSRAPVIALVTSLLLVAAIPLVAAWHGRVTRVLIHEPRVEVVAGPAPVLSGQALAEAVRESIAAQNPGARFSGVARGRAIHAGDRHARPDEEILVQLRCDELACLLVLQRQLQDKVHFQQALLARQLEEPYWQRQLQQATMALYR